MRPADFRFIIFYNTNSFINNAHIMHKVFATYNAQEIRVFEINLKISNF